MVHEALAGSRDVAFFEDELRSPVAVADLAGAVLELSRTPVAGVLHVAGPQAMSRLAFARAVAGADGDKLRAARSADQPVRRPLRCVLDSSRAAALLQTRLRPASEVLADGPRRPQAAQADEPDRSRTVTRPSRR